MVRQWSFIRQAGGNEVDIKKWTRYWKLWKMASPLPNYWLPERKGISMEHTIFVLPDMRI